ncbi:hypothetical protein E2C01_079948 [Portunus trituberculatus]|uniref:Uncharacterized protein n=1 Tax=Portunus trituberculatus TaxID=210409 RepID=A0A5B7IRW0_PORTR|nr:hypothetical protein [Portunus trituberculatus]
MRASQRPGPSKRNSYSPSNRLADYRPSPSRGNVLSPPLAPALARSPLKPSRLASPSFLPLPLPSSPPVSPHEPPHPLPPPIPSRCLLLSLHHWSLRSLPSRSSPPAVTFADDKILSSGGRRHLVRAIR